MKCGFSAIVKTSLAVDADSEILSIKPLPSSEDSGTRQRVRYTHRTYPRVNMFEPIKTLPPHHTLWRLLRI